MTFDVNNFACVAAGLPVNVYSYLTPDLRTEVIGLDYMIDAVADPDFPDSIALHGGLMIFGSFFMTRTSDAEMVNTHTLTGGGLVFTGTELTVNDI